MKAAVVRNWGASPDLGDFPDPVAGAGEAVAEVTAAGVHHFDLAKMSGKVPGTASLPFVPGSDGIARLGDGRRVFVDQLVAPYGTWAEKTLVRLDYLMEPAGDVDDVVAAALGNTGLAAWLALTWRARLQPGETVLVLGATGAVGTVAVQTAKILGARHVVAADRDADRLNRLRLRGADSTVELTPGVELAPAIEAAAGGRIDVVVDLLWGEPALAAMAASAQGARHVQIGQMAAPELHLPASVIRSAAVEVLGFMLYHAPIELRRAAYLQLTEHAARGDISIDVEAVPLSEVATACEKQRTGAKAKVVLTV